MCHCYSSHRLFKRGSSEGHPKDWHLPAMDSFAFGGMDTDPGTTCASSIRAAEALRLVSPG